jgi:hypothetical protein
MDSRMPNVVVEKKRPRVDASERSQTSTSQASDIHRRLWALCRSSLQDFELPLEDSKMVFLPKY